MTPHAVVVARAVGITLLLAAAAACAPAGGTSRASEATALTSPTAAIEATEPPTPTAPSTTGSPAAVGDAPPLALLSGAAGDLAEGDLGSFSWAGLSSDSPWVVGAVAGTVGTGSRLAVTFRPGDEPVSWQARWAPVIDGQAGTPRDGGRGQGDPIALTAPRTAGAWSLQLVVRFGPGRDAAWYWRVRVLP